VFVDEGVDGIDLLLVRWIILLGTRVAEHAEVANAFRAADLGFMVIV
jgi:hypothetical protein